MSSLKINYATHKLLGEPAMPKNQCYDDTRLQLEVPESEGVKRVW